MLSFATTVPVGIAAGLLLFTGSYEGGLSVLRSFLLSRLSHPNSQDETHTRHHGGHFGGHAHLCGLRRDAGWGFHYGPFIVEEWCRETSVSLDQPADRRRRHGGYRVRFPHFPFPPFALTDFWCRL